MSWIEIITHKNIKSSFDRLTRFIERQSGNKLKLIRTDGGGEYVNNWMKDYCEHNGVTHQKTIKYTPQQNGRAERLNRTLIEKARSLMQDSGLPKRLWPEAWTVANYLRNLSPSSRLSGRTPHECFWGVKPNLERLRVFGCLAYGKIPDEERKSKLDPKSIKCVFIGYEQNVKGYRLLDFEHERLIISRDVISDEEVLPYKDLACDEKRLGSASPILEQYEEDDEDVGVSGVLRLGRVDEVDRQPVQIQEPIEARGGPVDGLLPMLDVVETTDTEGPSGSSLDRLSIPESESELGDVRGLAAADERRRSRLVPSLAVPGVQGLTASGPVTDGLGGLTASRQPTETTVTTGVEGGPEVTAEEVQGRGSATIERDHLGSRVEYIPRDEPAPRAIEGGPRNLTRRPGSKIHINKVVEGKGKKVIAGIEIPDNLSEARKSIHWPQWEAALLDEFQSMKENGVGTLTELPKGAHLVKTKLVFNVKTDDLGHFEKFKVRKVACGYSQQKDVDYFHTSSPVIKASSLKILLSVVASEDMDMEQMDVKTAFLIPQLHEDIYMAQTPGYEDPKYPNHVWKLNKAIYGLKQAGFEWNEEAVKVIKDYGFRSTYVDPCVYVLGKGQSRILFALYVDDSLLCGGSQEDRRMFKDYLKSKWTIKEMGEPKMFLGITIKRDREKRLIHLSQPKASHNILESTGMMECKPQSTPMVKDVVLDDDETSGKKIDGVEYRTIIGKLLYLMITRPDLTVAITELARHQLDPKEIHWLSVKRLLRYLRGTMYYGIEIGGILDGSENYVSAYSDANLAKSQDGKSISGGLIKIGERFPIWSSKKQTVTAQSTAESEFIAMNECVKDIGFVESVVRELGIYNTKAMTIYGDNQAALKISEKRGLEAKTRHINRRLNNIMDHIRNGDIRVEFCKTQDMLADILTKPLEANDFTRIRNAL